MDVLEKEQRNDLLSNDWNASIKLNQQTESKLEQLRKVSEQEKVYLVSNSNELNIEAILSLLREHYMRKTWHPHFCSY